MTFPPCYTPADDDEPPDPSRRTFMIGSAAATAGLIVSPLLAQEQAKKRAADPHAIPISLNVNGRAVSAPGAPRAESPRRPTRRTG